MPVAHVKVEALARGAHWGVWTVATVEDIQGVTLDAAAAVDNGDGTVSITVTGHPFSTGDYGRIAGTANYDGNYLLTKDDANTIRITATYAAETFAITDTIKYQVHFTIDRGTAILRFYTPSAIYVLFDTTALSNNNEANDIILPSGYHEIPLPWRLYDGESLASLRTMYFHASQVTPVPSKSMRIVQS